MFNVLILKKRTENKIGQKRKKNRAMGSALCSTPQSLADAHY